MTLKDIVPTGARFDIEEVLREFPPEAGKVAVRRAGRCHGQAGAWRIRAQRPSDVAGPDLIIGREFNGPLTKEAVEQMLLRAIKAGRIRPGSA